MKNAITIFTIALMAFTNVTSASNSIILKDASFVIKNDKGLNEIKFVSSADASLIATELGSLKKSAKTANEIIADDIKITEASIAASTAVPIKKKAKKNQKIHLKKEFRN